MAELDDTTRMRYAILAAMVADPSGDGKMTTTAIKQKLGNPNIAMQYLVPGDEENLELVPNPLVLEKRRLKEYAFEAQAKKLVEEGLAETKPASAGGKYYVATEAGRAYYRQHVLPALPPLDDIKNNPRIALDKVISTAAAVLNLSGPDREKLETALRDEAKQKGR